MFESFLLRGQVFSGWQPYLSSCGVLLLAQTAYVLFGFGAGLIAVGPLAMLLPSVKDAVVLLFLVNIPAEAMVVRAGWRAIAWRGVLLLCAGIAAGVPIGTWALQRGDASFVLALLGLFLVLAGLGLFGLREGLRLRWPTCAVPPVGLLSGVLAGMFGTGGPPLILYYRLTGVDKETFRSNLMTIFLSIAIIRLPVYAASGLITQGRLEAALLVAPAVAIGALLGNRIHIRMKELTFQRAVAAALVVIGAALLIRWQI